jgi:hypothetical protein
MLARVGRQLFLMDAHGVIVGDFGPAFGDLDLPIVDGIATLRGRDGPRVDPDRVALTRRFFEALEARPELWDRVSQIDVTAPRDLVVLLDDDATALHVGDDRFVERLTTYFEMLGTLNDQFQDIDSVDLRFEGRLFVRSRGQVVSAAAGGERGK